jgi:predicted amidohydrolase YtcJ
MKTQLDLSRAGSWSDIVAQVAHAVAEAQPGELIRGRGWHQEKWSERPEPNVDGVPLHHELSAISPDNPVLLTHASGHATFANEKAMTLARITAATEDPPGGELLRDAEGNPTGGFRETAAGLLRRAYLSARPTDPRRLAIYARDECFAKGVTSFHDAGASFRDVDVFKTLAESRELGVRLYVRVREPVDVLAEQMAAYRMVDHAGHFLTVRAI